MNGHDGRGYSAVHFIVYKCLRKLQKKKKKIAYLCICSRSSKLMLPLLPNWFPLSSSFPPLMPMITRNTYEDNKPLNIT